jgi:hypothetical protein
MKHVVLDPFVAVLTFMVGVSIASISLVYPNSQSRGSLPVQPNAKLSGDSTAWQVILSFENRDLTKLDEKSKVELQKAIDTLAGPKKNEFLIPRLMSKMANAQGNSGILSLRSRL